MISPLKELEAARSALGMTVGPNSFDGFRLSEETKDQLRTEAIAIALLVLLDVTIAQNQPRQDTGPM